MVFIIIAAALLLLGILLSFLLAHSMARPRVRSFEKIYNYEQEHGFIRDFPDMPKEEYTVASFDGTELHAVYVPAAEESSKYVIISHGFTFNRYSSVKYLLMYRDMGFNCIIYDNRGHGANHCCTCTLGKLESGDLIAVIENTYTRFGDNIFLGLHGESMGAALQIMALDRRPKIKFVVNDCGYAVLYDVIRQKLRQKFYRPVFLARPSSFISKKLYGFSYDEIRPIDALRDNTVPICFVHGDCDSFVDCSHSVSMHEACTCYSELHIFPGAEHAKSIYSDEERYRRICADFISKIS